MSTEPSSRVNIRQALLDVVTINPSPDPELKLSSRKRIICGSRAKAAGKGALWNGGRKEGREKKEREKEKQRWSASDTAWLSIGGVGTVEGGETYWSVASCTSSDEGVSRTDDGGEEVVRKGDCNPV